MTEKMKRLRDRWRADERVQRRVYMLCTVAAIAMSALILVSIARGEGRAAPAPPSVPTAPDEGETLPLGARAEETQDPLPLTAEISDGDAGTLVDAALGRIFEAEEVSVHFHAPDGVALSVTMTRDALRDFLESGDSGVPPVLTALLPERFTLEGDFGFSVSGEGRIALETRGFTAFGIELTKYLPPSVTETAADALNSALPDSTPLRSAEIRDGSAVFTLEL